ncbi:unnamed protein product [Moneuplotes crassus]|uniref:Uncharacterized protein n=1 Tax=Euplotes crassus TaxID=5936 RepID=A0AAD1XY42_EUPCR|nr:unnamed protein product [Moneuplotes crassus]
MEDLQKKFPKIRFKKNIQFSKAVKILNPSVPIFQSNSNEIRKMKVEIEHLTKFLQKRLIHMMNKRKGAKAVHCYSFKEKAAIKIQTKVRMYLAKLKYNNLKMEKQLKEMQEIERKDKLAMEQWIRESEIEALKWKIQNREQQRRDKHNQPDLEISERDLLTESNISECLIDTQELLSM